MLPVASLECYEESSTQRVHHLFSVFQAHVTNPAHMRQQGNKRDVWWHVAWQVFVMSSMG